MTYGKHGWYWQQTDGTYGVVIANHRLLNKHFPIEGWLYGPGAEDVRYLTESEFKTLRIPRMLGVQFTNQEALKLEHDQKWA